MNSAAGCPRRNSSGCCAGIQVTCPGDSGHRGGRGRGRSQIAGGCVRARRARPCRHGQSGRVGPDEWIATGSTSGISRETRPRAHKGRARAPGVRRPGEPLPDNRGAAGRDAAPGRVGVGDPIGSGGPTDALHGAGSERGSEPRTGHPRPIGSGGLSSNVTGHEQDSDQDRFRARGAIEQDTNRTAIGTTVRIANRTVNRTTSVMAQVFIGVPLPG
jgi:hypothetical protein